MTKTKYYSLDEVKKHNTKGDYWIVINGGVYDLSRWASHHPGGELPIRYMAGHDSTDVFKAFHLSWVSEKKLPAFKIGEVADECKRSESSLVKDFRKVREEIERGLDTNYWFYVGHGIHLSVIFAVLVYGVVFSNNVYIQVASSITMALFWQQMAFVGHDIGHTAVTHNLKVDGLIGIFAGNMTTGISIGWWKKSHNAHHIVTNSVEFDPDIQHLPVLAITDKFFKSVRSMYHEKILYFDGLAKFFVSNQHWLYYLIMGLARYNLYAQSFLLVFSGTLPKGQNKYLEIFGLVFFWTWYIYLCSFLPSWTSLFIFVFVAHFLAGILHIQITLSHFSMETYHGHPMDAFKSSEFLRSQLATTMDIDCYPWLDFVHGGLQFQIEHHLFPRLPRHRLRAAKVKIIELCKKHGVTYRTKTFLEANIEIVQQLKETATKAQCISPLIWEGINAIG